MKRKILRVLLVLTFFSVLNFFSYFQTEKSSPFFPKIGEVYSANQIIRPDGDSTPLAWTSTGGNHYGELTTDAGDLVTQPTAPDTTTNVNNGGSAGVIDQYTMGTITATSVTAINVWVYGSCTKANSALSVDLYYDSATKHTGSVTLQIASGWLNANFTGLSLTQSQISGLEILIAGDAGGRTYTVDALYADVTYSDISISLATNGSVAFGVQSLSSTKDTTVTGINDTEAVTVDTGPADLDVKSTNFTEGGNTWTIGTTTGPDQVIWEFSPNAGVGWSGFDVVDTLYTLDTNVGQGTTRQIDLKITMPTSSTSQSQYSSTVTVQASAP